MRRSKAEECLDYVREALARRMSPEHIERTLRQRFGLEPFESCPGQAHENPHIDNCTTCMPRWGVIGEREKVT